VGSSVQEGADVYLPVHGLEQEVNNCVAIAPAKLKELLNRQAITHCLQFHFVVPSSKVFQDHMQTSFVVVLHDDSVPKDV
jgi:hypothetical protein